MLQHVQEWFRKRSAEKADRVAVWAKAEEVGSDGLTNFERDAIATLSEVTGPLTLARATSGLPVLFAEIPNSAMTLYLYADEAQITGLEPSYRRERWDFNSPQESVSDLVAYVRRALQPNNSLHRTRDE